MSFTVPAAIAGVALAATLAWGQGSETPAQAEAASAQAAAPSDAPPEAQAPKSLSPRNFVLDPKRSQLALQVFRDGAAAALAHDHVIHATEMAGQVIVDPSALESAKVIVTAQTRSLVNDDLQMRKQFGLDSVVPEKDRKAVDESMKGPDQLYVARYPTITFTSTSVSVGTDGKLMLLGDFTLRGVTKKLKLPVDVKIEGDTLTGTGKVRFKQSDWGITPYSAFLGAVKNKDEVILHVRLVAAAS